MQAVSGRKSGLTPRQDTRERRVADAFSNNQAANRSVLSESLRFGQNLPRGRNDFPAEGSLGELAGSASVATRRESKLRVMMAASMLGVPDAR